MVAHAVHMRRTPYEYTLVPCALIMISKYGIPVFSKLGDCKYQPCEIKTWYYPTSDAKIPIRYAKSDTITSEGPPACQLPIRTIITPCRFIP